MILLVIRSLSDRSLVQFGLFSLRFGLFHELLDRDFGGTLIIEAICAVANCRVTLQASSMADTIILLAVVSSAVASFSRMFNL